MTGGEYTAIALGLTETLDRLRREAAQRIGDAQAKQLHDSAAAVLRLLFAAAGAYEPASREGD